MTPFNFPKQNKLFHCKSSKLTHLLILGVSSFSVVSSSFQRLSPTRRFENRGVAFLALAAAATGKATYARSERVPTSKPMELGGNCDIPNKHGQSKSISSMSSNSDYVDTVEQLTGYLNAEDAAALDAELMSKPGFCLEQLMELAGLSVAQAVYEVVAPTSQQRPRILLLCGPGNNGGDGLVAARHLTLFGCDCVIVYPKRSSKNPHYVDLVKQCEDVGIPILYDMPTVEEIRGENGSAAKPFDVIVDSVFGFSFRGEPREPFKSALQTMMDAAKKGDDVEGGKKPVIVSVDVPSGWDVDGGDVSETGFVPDVLISLTAPKESARRFRGRHFVGGRFLPPKIAEKYNIRMPPYPGASQVVEITGTPQKGKDSKTWETQYAEYLTEKALAEERDNGNSKM